jgi:hypothetical protein
MNHVSSLPVNPEIVLSDTLGHVVRKIIELSKAYNTILILYEDDLSGNIQGAWAELDRLSLKTKKIGDILDGIEVHTFGMDNFDAGTLLEINLREASLNASHQDTLRVAYKSLLNELSLISVKVYNNGLGTMLMQ